MMGLLIVIALVTQGLSSSHNHSLVNSYFGFQFGSSGVDYSADISTSTKGDAFITGNTNQSLFGLNNGVQDVVVSKHDHENGTLLWGQQFGCLLPESGVAIVSSDESSPTLKGDVFVTGFTTGSIFQNLSSLLSYVSYEASNTDSAQDDTQTVVEEITICSGETFVATVCSYYWATSTEYPESPYFILYDSSGRKLTVSSNFYCLAHLTYSRPQSSSPSCETYSLHLGCSGSASCSATVALVRYQYSSDRTVDVFVTRHDSRDGAMLWGVQFGGSAFDVPADVDISPMDEGLYIAGFTQNHLYESNIAGEDFFLSKFNSSTGELIWGYQNGTSYEDKGTSVSCDPTDGGVYGLGSTGGSLFGKTAGGVDFFVLKLTSAGVTVWSVQYGTGYSNYPLSIACDTDGGVFVTGYTLKSFSPDQSFLYKLNSSTGSVVWKKDSGLSYDWSISIMNSSIYLASTHGSDYQLSKWDGDTGLTEWSLIFARVPVGYAPSNFIHASVSVTPANEIRMSGSVVGDVYGSSRGQVDLFLVSPNLCEAGYYSSNYVSPCLACPSNHYSSESSSGCHKCDRGYVSDPGSSSCSACYGGYYHHGHSECFGEDNEFIF
jgi:hypothetical protein